MIPIAELHNDILLVYDELESGYFPPAEVDDFINLAQDSIFTRLTEYQEGELSLLERRLGFDSPVSRGRHLSNLLKFFNSDTVVSLQDRLADGLNYVNQSTLTVDSRQIDKIIQFAIKYYNCTNFSQARYAEPSKIVTLHYMGASLLKPEVYAPTWHYNGDQIKFYPTDDQSNIPTGTVALNPEIQAAGYVRPLAVDNVSTTTVDSEFGLDLKELIIAETIKHMAINRSDPEMLELVRRMKHG